MTSTIDTRKTIDLRSHTNGFSFEQLENIKKILRKLPLSGLSNSWNSGSTFWHIAYQLKDKRWVLFHGETGDVTISAPYKYHKGIHTAFWNKPEKVTYIIPKNYKTDGDGVFSPPNVIAKDINENNFIYLDTNEA